MTKVIQLWSTDTRATLIHGPFCQWDTCLMRPPIWNWSSNIQRNTPTVSRTSTTPDVKSFARTTQQKHLTSLIYAQKDTIINKTLPLPLYREREREIYIYIYSFSHATLNSLSVTLVNNNNNNISHPQMAAITEPTNLEPEKQTLLSHHKEKHFTAGEIVRDIIIGVSDGLTVPFALAAGLSGANATSSIVLTAGIAEVAAGAISMGLGGYVFFLLFAFCFINNYEQNNMGLRDL